ncbi:MAG: hypothetical protein SPI71_02115 [Acidaminococcaceae bacterium]|nr:hypothetical protein [Acidaminococcaceae bacterium]
MERWELFLRECGFVPWQGGGMEGFHRHIDFVKDCLAGEIGRYSADDYIIMSHAGKASEQWLKQNWQSKEDVMQHRFLLVDSDHSELLIKSYWFGLRGWLQILHYRKGDKEKRFDDLIYLVEQRNSV